MALSHSPRIVTDGLKLLLDAANRKSTINAAPPSLINTYGWTVSSGSIGIYGQNGPTNENARLYSTDPWGNQSIVWGTFPDGSNQADGGWNTNFLNIDRTKLYRFSVWVRRTSSTTGGTFYFGTNSNGGVFSVADGTQKGNPYWECSGTGKLVQNQWYLVCGHIYPVNTNITTNHPDSAYFTVSGGAVPALPINFCNIVSDLKWGPTSTNVQHRTYHYYCADNTTRLQFAFPRIDECDGNQPSIGELLSNGDSQWKDLSGSNNHGVLINNVVYNGSTGGSLIFDGINNRVTLPNVLSSQSTLTQSWTVSSWLNISNSVNQSLLNLNIGLFPSYGVDNSLLYLSGGVNDYYTYGGDIGGQGWVYITFRFDNATGYRTIYRNGVNISTIGPNNTSTPTGIPNIFIAGSSLIGNLATLEIYNRVLTDSQVQQNFNAFKGRYNI